MLTYLSIHNWILKSLFLTLFLPALKINALYCTSPSLLTFSNNRANWVLGKAVESEGEVVA